MNMHHSRWARPWLWLTAVLILAVGIAVACVAPNLPPRTDATPAPAADPATATPAEQAVEEPAATPSAAEAEAAAETEDGAQAEPAAQPTPNPAAAELASPALPSSDTYKGLPVGFTEDGLPYRGDPNAPIVMVEYSDFQCPFCNRFFIQTEPALDEAYVRTGQVRVVFHDLPLAELHPNATAAHVASLCVADQGSAEIYWTMYAAIFRSVAEWSEASDPAPIFARLAEESGADSGQYDACIAAGDNTAVVDARVQTAMSRGFSGTPSFQFVRAADSSVYQLVGAQPYEQFAALLDPLVAGETPQVAQEPEQQPGSGIPFWATAEGLAPDPDRPGVNMAGDEYRGSADAPVTVIEFSDFQCPYCKRHVDETQPALDQEYVETGKVHWVFKHFPLNIHPQAPAAAAAAECAGEQGKFWEMHAQLFASVESWSIEDPNPVLIDLAGQLGLDQDAFTTCLAEPEIAARVQSDMQDGAPYVRGTPTFIVLQGGQGSIIPGALPVDRFKQVLDELLNPSAGSEQ